MKGEQVNMPRDWRKIVDPGERRVEKEVAEEEFEQDADRIPSHERTDGRTLPERSSSQVEEGSGDRYAQKGRLTEIVVSRGLPQYQQRE